MNKNNRIKIIGFAIILILIITFVSFNGKGKQANQKTDEIKQKEKITPLLYEVTKDGSSNKIYLFGSIHVANITEIEFPKYIMDAYKNSNYLACEFNIIDYQKNKEKILEDTKKMMYQDNTSLKDHINKDIYEKLINFLKEKNNYTPIYDKYKPFFFESLLSSQLAKDAKINTNQGIDDYFIKKAINDKKIILEVESSDFQISLSNSFPDKLYSLMFDELIDEYDENIQVLKNLYQSWKDGDKDKILSAIDNDLHNEKNYTKDIIQMINDYNKRMNDDRNNNMSKKVIEYFSDNYDVFFMVGTAHLITKTGIINYLEKQGFTVKLVK